MDSWSVSGFAQKTQNTFLDSEIHIWIFPKKRTLRVDIQIKSFYLSVHVVVELSSNIMRGNWGFRWWPKNALLWQITSNQNLVGMDQAVDTLRNTVSIPEGHVWSLAWAWFKGSNCPQMRLFTLYKNISPLTIIHVWTDAIREISKGVLSDALQPEVRRIFFNMLWRCQVWNAKGVFSHTDDLSEILSKSTAQECKRCNSGWLASLKSLSTVNPWTDY